MRGREVGCMSMSLLSSSSDQSIHAGAPARPMHTCGCADRSPAGDGRTAAQMEVACAIVCGDSFDEVRGNTGGERGL